MYATIKITVLYELRPPKYIINELIIITIIGTVEIVISKEFFEQDWHLFKALIVSYIVLNQSTTLQA